MKSPVLTYRRVATFVVAIAIIVGGALAYKAIFLPIDDPRYFCQVPDPTPQLADDAPVVLQNCAVGTTVRVALGQTIAVDLTASIGVDRRTQWTAPTVSDSKVLVTVYAPQSRFGPLGDRVDEVANYLGAREGTATISAIEQDCAGSGCNAGHSWNVIVLVGSSG